jgi:uncharacterized protein YjhX (UPF0386 family)
LFLKQNLDLRKTVHSCTQGEGGGHLMYPLKRLKKLEQKNAIKNKNGGTPYILSQPQVPLQKYLKMTVHL